MAGNKCAAGPHFAMSRCRRLRFAAAPAATTTDAEPAREQAPPVLPWSSISFNGRLRRVRHPTEPLHMVDDDDGAAVAIAPELVDDLPPTDGDIVYRAWFDADGRLVGRLVPERAVGAAPGATGVAAFGPRADAAALFLARYMAYSRAVLIAAADALDDVMVREMMHAIPGVLLIYGIIDAQGIRLIFDECGDEPTRARALRDKYGQQPVEWFAELVRNADALQAACCQLNCHQISAKSRNVASTLAVLADFDVCMSPEPGVPASHMWTSFVETLRTAIVAYYRAHGRVAAPGADFVAAVHANDMLFWHDADGSAARMLDATDVAAIMAPMSACAPIADAVHATVSRLASCVPIVVVEHAEQWNPYMLCYMLATLVWASAPPLPDGLFAATGSAVPVKLVFLCDTDDHARQNQFSSA
jgi:hypothetical protein